VCTSAQLTSTSIRVTVCYATKAKECFVRWLRRDMKWGKCSTPRAHAHVGYTIFPIACNLRVWAYGCTIHTKQYIVLLFGVEKFTIWNACKRYNMTVLLRACIVYIRDIAPNLPAFDGLWSLLLRRRSRKHNIERWTTSCSLRCSNNCHHDRSIHTTKADASMLYTNRKICMIWICENIQLIP
jgi:hypothetical protein